MLKLYTDKSVQMAKTSIQDDLDISMSHLKKREREFYEYLVNNKKTTFSPKELAEEMKVSNRTIINRCSALSAVGLLKANLVSKRIRSYTMIK